MLPRVKLRHERVRWPRATEQGTHVNDNPYAPSSVADALESRRTGRIWRTGNIVHMDRDAELPPRCVRCNAPAQTRLARRMYWHSPWWALTIFAGLITYAIVALVVRKRADVAVGLCEQHAKRRRKLLLIAWSSAFAGLGSCAALTSTSAPTGMVLGLVGVIAALLIGQRQASVLRPVRIDAREVRLRGAAEPFLCSLEREAA